MHRTFRGAKVVARTARRYTSETFSKVNNPLRYLSFNRLRSLLSSKRPHLRQSTLRPRTLSGIARIGTDERFQVHDGAEMAARKNQIASRCRNGRRSSGIVVDDLVRRGHRDVVDRAKHRSKRFDRRDRCHRPFDRRVWRITHGRNDWRRSPFPRCPFSLLCAERMPRSYRSSTMTSYLF